MTEALIASIIVSLISFVGAFSLVLTGKIIKKITHFLIALSAGTLLGGAFLHLLPEALEKNHNYHEVFLYFLIGFSSFFVLERILHWRHCHHSGDKKCKVHPVGIMNLFGDGIHNFIDGLLIAGAFAINSHLGISTTIAIIMHEIPQEIGDFGVLIHAGYTAKKALFFNFLSAITAVFGVLCGFLFIDNVSGFNNFLIPFAAGGFLHISASDLVPELHNEKQLNKAIISFLIFIGGLVLMWALANVGHTH